MVEYWQIKSDNLLIIIHGDLQFVAYSRQNHRFTSPVIMAIHALK